MIKNLLFSGKKAASLCSNWKSFGFILIAFLFSTKTVAQVSVTATGGTLSSSYTTLGAAFTAINAGTHTGVINIAISSNTTETAAMVLNSTGAGSASYTSVKINPIADNVTVSGPTVTGRGLIELNGADNVTIDGDNPNTSGTNRNLTITNTAAATVTYAMAIRIAVDATTATTANSNTIKNCIINGNATGRNASANTSTTASENLSYGIYAGNRNVTTAATNAPAAIASTTTVVGTGATYTNLTIDNNQINACARAIMIQGSAATVATGLLISNNIIGASTIGSATNVYSYGIGVQGSSNGIVRNNNIQNIESYLGSSLRGISIGDISTVAGDQFTIEKNIISNIISRSTGAWASYGINVLGGTGNVIQNNFIYGLNSVFDNSNYGQTYGIRGIRIASGTGHKIYHNSVNLSGAILTSSNPDVAACFTVTASTSTGLDVRNNIFNNTMTGATASTITCMQLPSALTSTFALTLNNNAYYSAGTVLSTTNTSNLVNTYTVAGFNASTTTPATTNQRAYTTTIGSATNDNASYASSNAAPFTNATNLHLNSSSSEISNVESKGANVSVATDIDGDARGTTPDIGADEITIVTGANDAGISAITTSSITCPGTQNVTVTLKNYGTAALTSATINWSVNGVAQTPYSWTGSLASGATANVVVGTYNFLGSVSYTIVASTASPNASTDANTANDSTTSAAFQTSLSGTYTVGTGGNFTNLTAAATYINNNNICGPTVLSLTSAYSSSGETFPIAINAISGLSATNTLTIKPATGATPTISGSSTSSIIKLNGADYVTIDGSNAAGGTTKDLTITNTSTTSSTAAIWLSSLGAAAGSTNNTVKNTNISTGTLSNLTYGITLGGATLGIAGADNDSNTIQNNAITVASNGIDAIGTSSNVNDNLVISGNTVSYTSGSLASIGIRVGYGLNGSIAGNTISASSSIAGTPVGISIETGFTSSSITKNKINGITTSATTGYAGRGITIGTGTASSNLTVANNMIYGVNGSNFSSFGNSSSIGIGIGMIGGGATLTVTTGGVNLFYNSINMYGSYTRPNVCVTTALYIGSGASALDIRNNVLVNSMNNTDTSAGASKNYAVYSAAANTAFTNINYNDYYVSGTQGVLGFLSSDATTIAAWRTATGKDVNSISTDPVFISNTNLHLNSGTPSAVESAGTAVSITDDIDGDTRGTSPDMGADEITVVVGPNDAGISAIPTTGITCPGTQNIIVTLKNYGTAALTSTTINWSVNGVSQTAYSWTGSLASGATVDVVLGTYNFLGGVNYTIIATTSLPNGATDSNTANDSKTSAVFQTSLSGTYTVGAGGNFTTLTAAVSAANAKGLCGPTVFSLTDALYTTSETFPITINSLAGASATNTLTIKPATSATPIIRDNNSTGIIVLDGANYVIIDGSNISGGSTKNLTIRNNNAVTGVGIGFKNGASNNVVKYNNILTAQASTTTYTGSVTFSTSTAAAGNNNNTIQENKFGPSNSLPTIAVYNLGSSTAKQNTGNMITKNDISDFAYAGIYDTGFSSGFIYDGNLIYGTQTQTSSTMLVGMLFDNATIYSPTIKNNKIYDLKTTNTSTTTGYLKGIDLYDIAASTCLIYNNMINLYGNGAGAPGIRISGIEDESTVGTVNIYYNSVNITGSASSASGSFGFLKNYSDTTVLKNNIFSNIRISSGTGAQYSIVWDSSQGGALTSDYNDFYSSGNANNILAATTANITTLADWKSTTGKDANSLNVMPSFVSTTDLHITAGCTSLESAGTPISGITTDFDGATRSATTPDIGADEFTGNIPPKVTSVTNGENCGTGSVLLTANSTDPSVTGYNWYTVATGGTAVNGATPTTTNWSTPSLSTTTNYYVAAYNGTCESDTRILVTATIKPTPTDIVVSPTILPSSSAAACDIDYVKLEATGGMIASSNVNVLNMTFENGLTDSVSGTWTTANNSTSGTPSNSAWTIRNNAYVYSSVTFNSNDASKFIMSNSDSQGVGGITNTELTSPVFSLKNYTSATLTFYHYYRFNNTESTKVQISTDGGANWATTDLATYTSTQGTSTAFSLVTLNLSSYLNQENLKIRFLYNATYDYYWAIDNIKISGDKSEQKVVWSPVTGLYTDSTLTTPYNGTDYVSTVYAAPTTATTYTAKATLGTCDKTVSTASIVRLKKEFVGPGTDWNTASNWFPAQVPDSDKCASIPATKTVVINVNNAETKSLTIASTGKTTIAANSSLKVMEAINITNNAANDNLTLESDASLLQVNGSAVNTGKIYAKRDVKMRQLDYTYWSSPVKDQVLLNTVNVNAANSSGGFSEGTPNNRTYYYNETNDKFYPTTDAKFVNGKGYAIRGKSTYGSTPTSDTNLKFVGEPNNGSYSINVQKSPNSPATVEHGYNMIGNPYPSNMDFVKFFYLGNNSNVINAKAWFWTNVTPTLNQDGSAYAGNNYATITLTGGTPPTYSDTTVTPSPGSGAYIPTKNIKVGQGFIVQAKNIGTAQTLTFDNTIRTNESGLFFNNKNNSSDVNRYWVKLTSPSKIVNTILIGYIDGATNQYDANYDADLLSIGDDSFYSKLNTQKLQIQARVNPLNIEDIIPLGTKYSSAGSYKISLGNKEGIFESENKIYLLDKLNNTYTDLTAQDYIFTANKGTDETRFEIVYKNKEVLSANDVKKSDFLVYKDGGYFVITSSRNLGDIELYDASGKLVGAKSSSQKEFRWDVNALPSGVYIIRAENSGNIRTKKIIK
ncbi:T9SS type A sorting domain-containing protein [Epilithonimonas sp. UC225_85]|uniref:Ig-like domain-containing protein n=1 Tax=Epilithonimonas sp. UC225_85 TaxID=3350167 RepID=UPI0036D42523